MKTRNHNTMVPVGTCKTNQCIKYLKDEKWVPAVVLFHSEGNLTDIRIEEYGKEPYIVAISSDRIIDDCSAPIFAF